MLRGQGTRDNFKLRVEKCIICEILPYSPTGQALALSPAPHPQIPRGHAPSVLCFPIVGMDAQEASGVDR